MNEDIDVLNGHTLALSMTLNAIIQTLPALACAQAALHLKIAQEEALQEDQDTPPAESRARNQVLENYVALLSAAAENG